MLTSRSSSVPFCLEPISQATEIFFVENDRYQGLSDTEFRDRRHPVEIVPRNGNALRKPTVSTSDNQVLLKVKIMNKVEVLTWCLITIAYLGGGFKYVCTFTPIPREMIQFDYITFFQMD